MSIARRAVLTTRRIAGRAFGLAALAAYFVRAEIAEVFQETEELAAISRVQFRVQGILVHSLGQHLRDIALYVVGDAPLDLRLAAESLVALEQISHRLHHINFEPDA